MICTAVKILSGSSSVTRVSPIRGAKASRRSAMQGNSREGCAHPVGLAYKQRASFASGELKLRGVEVSRGEAGGSMLSVSGPDKFYYLRNFHDLRCKYARVFQ